MAKKEKLYKENESRSIKDSPIKTLIFILILVFYGSLLVHKIELPAGDDLPRHIVNGEMVVHGHFDILYSNVYSFTETNHPFVNHHWLSGVVFYVLYQTVGWNGLVIFKIIVLLIAFIILFLTATKKSHFWSVALFSIPTILILVERTGIRPEIFSYFFIAIFLYLLSDLEEHPEQKKIFWLIPLQLFWVNLHIFFIIGIILVAGSLLEKIILHRKNLKVKIVIRKLGFMLVALALVCLINPNGLKGALEPFRHFDNYGIDISELQSITQLLQIRPFWEDISIITFMWMVPLLALSFFFRFGRKQIFYFLASVGTAIAGFSATRNLPFFGLIFLPAISGNLDDYLYGLRDRLAHRASYGRRIAKTLFFLFLGILSALIVLGGTGQILAYRKSGIGLSPHAQDGAVFLKENSIHGPMFNDFDSGSYLIYHLFPKEKVFIDNRFEAYSPSFFTGTYLPMMQEETIWQEMSQKYHFNVIFLYQYNQGWYIRPFLYARMRDPAWSLVYAGTYHFIFVRNTVENHSVIERFLLTPEHVKERLDYLVKSPHFDDQVAAADIFNLIGREDLGADTFLNVVARWPKSGKTWMIMGEWKLLSKNSSSDPLLAITYLEKAIDLGYKTAEAYYYLGVAYNQIGQLEKAKKAVLYALKINPEYQDIKNFLLRLERDIDQGKGHSE